MRILGVSCLVIGLVACDDFDDAPLPEAPVAASLPTSLPASSPTALATVVAQKGRVEVQRQKGAWQAVNVGDRLDVTDAIRTSEDAEVDIAVNEVKLRIHERSEFAVKKLSDSVIRGRLTGRLESQVQQGKGSVEVEAEGSDAVVRTQGGHFSMISNGKGVVAVANISGDVNVAAKGKSVNLSAGQVSHVSASTGLDKPSAALKNVLLAVEWPAAKVTNKKTIAISGRAEIGSRIVIQGALVHTRDDGTFTAEVTLRPGRQELAVVATDVLGRRKHSKTSLTHDAKAPNVKLKDKLWQ